MVLRAPKLRYHCTYCHFFCCVYTAYERPGSLRETSIFVRHFVQLILPWIRELLPASKKLPLFAIGISLSQKQYFRVLKAQVCLHLHKLYSKLETSVDVLYYFLHNVWEQEPIPENWQHGLIVKMRSDGMQQSEGHNAHGACSKSSWQNHNYSNTG